MASRLDNPELDWMAPPGTIDRAEVERRIGPTAEPLQVLSGGLKNLNVRVGRDRVLRIRSGEPERIAAEAALLGRPWRSFRTPSLLAEGDDFLLLEHVEHGPLRDDAAHGAAVGRALAEIHGIGYPATGYLGADLSLARVFPDDGPFALGGYGHWELGQAAPWIEPELRARIAAFFDDHDAETTAALGPPVLCHCDFKVSNLHWTPGGELLVLDWELAWAGARFIDIGQLLRWRPPEPFVRAFAAAYVANGGVLVEGWRRFAAAIDLCALLGLLARHAAARAGGQVLGRIVETLVMARES